MLRWVLPFGSNDEESPIKMFQGYGNIYTENLLRDGRYEHLTEITDIIVVEINFGWGVIPSIMRDSGALQNGVIKDGVCV